VDESPPIRHISMMDGIAQTLLAHKSLAIGLWLALLLVAERLWPAAIRPVDDVAGDNALARAGWTRVLRNAGLFVVNAGISPLIVVPVSVWAAAHGLGWRPTWFGGWSGLLFDLVLLDFWIYWWHRANHNISLLWRFHVVHHLDRFLDATTATRFHFGEVLLSACARALVIVVFDIPLASVLIFEAVVLAASIFQHSNLRLPQGLERALARVIVTPSLHWLHHHAVRRDTDSTYGTFFSFWDRIFGSVAAGTRTPDMTIGLDRGPGQGAAPDEGFVALLTRPARTG
jgi:sterol desaturase/sphingolipid hydroxylase (fatty acid hydroxylase superfamily)